MQLKDIPGIGEKTISALEKHGIEKINDLLSFYPRAYRTYNAKTIKDSQIGEWVSLLGNVTRPISRHGAHVSTQISTLKDETGSLTLRWFNMPYITRSLVPEESYLVRGQLTIFGNTKQIVAPQLTKVADSYLPSDEMIPIYPKLGTLKSGNLRKIISSSLEVAPPMPETLSDKIRQKHHLLDLNTAIRYIHQPPSKEDLEAAIKRLSFDELYDLQVDSLQKSELNKVKTQPLDYDQSTIDAFLSSLPFTPTGAQARVIQEILSDLSQSTAMHRLLAGEVGSGKTLVAATIALASHSSGRQTIVMAPTLILAEQLYHSFTDLLGNKLSISLITASSKGDPHANIVVGTQALLSPKHKFSNVGLIIVDEQHRFGVKQREYLTTLTPAPHMLMMTATPIPRTLAMTIFANMNISRLDELPASRLPIKTYLVGEEKRESAFNWIKKEVLTNHNQVFIVVPLIEEAEDEEGNAKKSLKLLETSLKQRFPDLTVDIMHGKMKDVDKTTHLQAFRDGITQILVATSMVEVGIDIPSANIMVIEDAERFGLAQLHQLRGRVGRGKTQGYCLLFTSSSSLKIKERLSYFVSVNNGEKLALYDLDNRGPGELFGESQHGFFSLHFASIYDTELLQSTHAAALSSLKKT